MTREFYVTNSETIYSDHGSIRIRLYGRDRDGEPDSVTVTGFEPYFYVPWDERENVLPREHSKIERVQEPEYESLFDERVAKVVVKKPSDVHKVTDNYEKTYEADVGFTNRLRIDKEIYTGVRVSGPIVHYSQIEPVEIVDIEPRVTTFDIEIDDRNEMPVQGDEIVHTDSEVVSIVTHDSVEDDLVGFINLDGRSLSSTLPEVIENGEAPGSLDRLFFDANEKLLLKSFIEWVVEHDPDLISAWNGNGFDLPYLFKRMEKVGIDPSKLARETRFPGQSDVPPDAWLTRSNTPRIVGRTCYDMMDAWEATKFSEVKCTLENAANMELGEGKVDHADQSIYEMWRDDPALLLEYNAVDVRLTVEVDKAAGVLTDRMELKNAVGVSFEETLYAKDFIGMMVRRKLHEWDLVGPTKADGKPDNSDFEGAFTFPAYEGVRSNVISIDLASLYPFTMWMLNSSPEVLVEVYEDGEAALDALEGTPEFENHERAIAPNGAVFDLTKHGLFRELVDEAMEIAAEAKRKRNAAPAGSEEEEKWSEKYNSRKAIRNSLYGVLGYIWFFLYDKDVAGAVTTMGQRVIQRTSEYINSETTGEVIYGDTDSCYIAWPEHWSKKRALEATQQAVNTLNDTEYPALAEEWGMPGDESKWEIEIEDYSERFYQAGKKKRYAKRVTWKEGMAFGEVMDEPEIEIKGFEYKRSDTPPLLADLQKNVLQGIMAGMSDSDLRGLVFEAGEKITRTGVDWDYIGIPGGIGKRLGTYDNPGAHIRASKNANELLGLGFGKGDKPSRVYLEPKDVTVGETTERIDVIAFDRGEELEPIESQISVDVPTMREKIIAKPMGRILDPIDIDVDAALSGQEQGALTDWV